jgi:hypothetical protein
VPVSSSINNAQTVAIALGENTGDPTADIRIASVGTNIQPITKGNVAPPDLWPGHQGFIELKDLDLVLPPTSSCFVRHFPVVVGTEMIVSCSGLFYDDVPRPGGF